MDEPESSPPSADSNANQDGPTAEARILSEQPSQREYKYLDEKKCHNPTGIPMNRTPSGIGWDRVVELILAGAITLFAAAQWITSCANNSSTSQQANRLLQSADRIDDAADSFSTSSSKINSGVADAVTKLDEQTKKMDAARTSSEADSAKSLQETIDSAHLDERAWIGECGEGVESFEKGKPIRIFIKLCNSGRTPAYRVQESLMWAVSPIPVDAPGDANWEQLYYTPGNAVPPQGSFMLHAGGNAVGTLRTPQEDQGSILLNAKYDDILAGTTILYFYGRIAYSDTFGKVHHTELCIVLANPETKELQFCRKRNELD